MHFNNPLFAFYFTTKALKNMTFKVLI